MMSSTIALDILKRQRGALMRAIRAAPPRDVALLDGILALLESILESIEPIAEGMDHVLENGSLHKQRH